MALFRHSTIPSFRNSVSVVSSKPRITTFPHQHFDPEELSDPVNVRCYSLWWSSSSGHVGQVNTSTLYAKEMPSLAKVFIVLVHEDHVWCATSEVELSTCLEIELWPWWSCQICRDQNRKWCYEQTYCQTCSFRNFKTWLINFQFKARPWSELW